MSETDREHRHAVALFRYGVITDLVRVTPATPGLYQRIAAETIRHWLKRYRAGSFDALAPKPRADRGRPRKIPDDIAEQLVALKAQHPRLSVAALVRHARSAGHIPDELDIAPSTVHRLLAREGLMRKRPEDPTTLDRRRFTYQRAGELWMSDVMHGPSVVVEGKVKRKSYLIAFLDDATRVIPYAAFTLAESTQAFLPVFKQALMRRGLPDRL